jgi:hypothetical protein
MHVIVDEAGVAGAIQTRELRSSRECRQEVEGRI